jgi:membrane protease YdiL (CAAX protease family)
MTTYKTNVQKEMSLQKILCMIFIPSSILTIVYIITGSLKHTIPSLLLFYICATLILFPIEIGVVLNASKKEYGSYSLKSAFTNYNKMSWWKIFIYGAFLFAFAGIMSVTVAPLENNLFAPISNKITQSMPAYFAWNNIDYFKQYSKDILLLTCVGYFIFNVIVGPIVEELFFRGYLTSKISRYGNFAPLIITILFSLYHFWLPFNNLFRISVFFPAALIAWRKKNIYISIVFHCLCNLLATVSFIISVYSG